MIYLPERDFPSVLSRVDREMAAADPCEQERWQGISVRDNPAARAYELRNVCFEVDLGGIEDLDHWRGQTVPNLPWADDHFAERVGGEPLNPAVQWKNWPWGRNAAKFRNQDEIFNHTYTERFWPRYARLSPRGEIRGEIVKRVEGSRVVPSYFSPRVGIAHEYGDLQSLVEYLAREPHTRQAWIPLFFPEDTGYGDGGRKMCSLGYQFLMRDGRLHVWYPLRSCDVTHHLRDDCYLAVRLLLWALGRCREIDSATWNRIVPGTYAMHITSLHVFENDMRELRRRYG